MGGTKKYDSPSAKRKGKVKLVKMSLLFAIFVIALKVKNYKHGFCRLL